MNQEFKCWKRIGEYQFFLDSHVDTPFTQLIKDSKIPFTPAFIKRNDKQSRIYKDGHVYYVDTLDDHLNQKEPDLSSAEWIIQEAIETPDTTPCDIKLIYQSSKGVVFSYVKFNKKATDKIVYRHLGAEYIRLFPHMKGPLTQEAQTALDAMRIDPSNMKIPASLKDIVEAIGPEYYARLQEECSARYGRKFNSKKISFDFKFGSSASNPINGKRINLHSSHKPKWYALEINSCPDDIGTSVFMQHRLKKCYAWLYK